MLALLNELYVYIYILTFMQNNLPGNTAFGSLNQFKGLKGSIDNINLEHYLVMQYDLS